MTGRLGVVRSPVLALALAAGGCTWVTQDDVDALQGQLDDDQDGYDKSEDCDDTNAEIYPLATELWYDGIDQDCSADDDYDADKDGYVRDEHIGLSTAGAEGTGGLPGGDCNDNDELAYPGADDVWYDGKDRDCGGEDDYDADGDGWVGTNYGGLETENAEGTGGLPEGDCADDDGTVYPEAEDTWYDGVDSDCSGNDDWDQDEDGYYDVDTAPDGYGETEHAPGTGTAYPGDCDDLRDDVNIGITDAWYDGLDADCGGNDDYDFDEDLYVPSEYEGLATEGVDTSGLLPGGDCDDSDAEVHPGQIEVVGDLVDQDCDGTNDGFELRELEGYTFADPRGLVWSSNEVNAYVALLVDSMEGTDGSSYQQSGLAFAVDASLPDMDDVDLFPWLGNTADPGYTLTDGLDIIVDDDDLHAAVGWTTSAGTRILYTSSTELASGSSSGATSAASFDDGFTSISLAQDEDDSVLSATYEPVGNLHAVGCEDSTAAGRYLRVNPVDYSSNYLTDAIDDLDSAACVLHFEDDPTGTLWTAEAAGLVGRTFDREEATLVLTDLTTDDSLDGLALDSVVDDSGPWIVVADDSSSSVVVVGPDLSHTVLSATSSPTTVNATLADDGQLVIAYADSLGRGWVTWGHPDSSFSTPLLVTSDFLIEECAAYVSDSGERLLVAAIGESKVALAHAEL